MNHIALLGRGNEHDGIGYGKYTYRFMGPVSSTRVRVESAIQERSCGAVEIPVGEGGCIYVAPICDMLKNRVENVRRNGVSS
jgi:hypothetical protein